MGKEDTRVRGKQFYKEVQRLYRKYGYDEVNVCVNRIRVTTGGAPKMICGEKNANVRISFYTGKKVVDCSFNTERPNLMEDFIKLQVDLTQWLLENGYSKCTEDYIGNIYFLQLKY